MSGGSGRRDGIAAPGQGRGGAVLRKAGFFQRDGGCRGRWGGRAAGGARRGANIPSIGVSAIFASKVPRCLAPGAGASLNIWREEIRQLCVC